MVHKISSWSQTKFFSLTESQKPVYHSGFPLSLLLKDSPVSAVFTLSGSLFQLSTVRNRLRILPSSSKNSKLLFCSFFVTFYLWRMMYKCTSVPNPHLDPYVFGPPGSASGSVSQRYESEDPDPYKMSRIPYTGIVSCFCTAVFRIRFHHGLDGSGSRSAKKLIQYKISCAYFR